ncbi:MAG: hypothetical protein IIA87_02660 [Nanoarchaeota archaeon]|nr:hypothetical protein [Nanoarchaeota archaeon]
MDLGWPHSIPAIDDHPEIKHTLEVHSFDNPKGEKARIGVSRFRDGYDLWLIASNGHAVRT